MSKKQAPADFFPVLDSGCAAHVVKGPVAIVAVEDVGTEVGHKQVGIAVVVEISDGGPQPVSGLAQAGLFRNIHEFPAAHVPIERVGGNVAQRSAAERRAVDQVNVEQAIAVVVEYREAGADRFHDVLSPRTAVRVHEVDAGFTCDVHKVEDLVGLLGLTNCIRTCLRFRP